MKRTILTAMAFATATLVSGCLDVGGGSAGGSAADQAARAVVGPIVLAQVPGERGQALVSCIIENATAEELIQIAGSDLSNPGATTVLLVSDILARPESVECATQRLTA